MIDQAVNTYGKLDILVNNVGIMDKMTPAADITDELWDNVFAINTTSMMRSTRKALSVFLEAESGVIINIDRKSTRLNSSHVAISYAVFCLIKKKVNKENIE